MDITIWTYGFVPKDVFSIRYIKKNYLLCLIKYMYFHNKPPLFHIINIYLTI